MDSLSSANPLHGPIDHEVLLLGFLIHYQEDFEKLPAVFFERKVKILGRSNSRQVCQVHAPKSL